jgi:hypothetical protein
VAVRIDGRPRQRLVAYSAATARSAPGRRPRPKFLEAAAARLDRLADRITPAERKRIDRTLTTRVKRPTRREIATEERQFGQMVAAIRALRGRAAQ